MLDLCHHQFNGLLVAERGGQRQRHRLRAGIFAAGLENDLVPRLLGEGIEITDGIGVLDKIDDIKSHRKSQRPMGHRLEGLVALHFLPAEDAADAPLYRRNKGGAAHQQHTLYLAAGDSARFRHIDGIIQNVIEGDEKIVLLQKIQQIILGIVEFIGLEPLGIKEAAAAFRRGRKLLLDLASQGEHLRQDLLAVRHSAVGTTQQILQDPAVNIIAAEKGTGLAQHPALRRPPGSGPGKGFRHPHHRNIQRAAAKIDHAHYRTGPGGAVGNGGCHRLIHQPVRHTGVIFGKKG